MANVDFKANPSVAAKIGEVAKDWETAYTKAPEKVTGFLSEVVKHSGKFFVPASEIGGGAWVFTKAGTNALNSAFGKDVPGFHASTSTSDAVVATTVYGLTALAGAGLSIHGALKAIQAAAAAAQKA